MNQIKKLEDQHIQLKNRLMKIDRPKPYREIPEDAKRVFKGIITDVYHWQQKMFDGTYTTFEMLKRQDTVNVIPVTDDGKIILTQQEQPGSKPFVGLAGGRVNWQEDPQDAAVRELLEETGFQPENLELWFAMQPTGLMDWAVFTFIAKGCKKVGNQHLDSGEKINIEFLTFDEFMKRALEEDFRDKEIQTKIAQALIDKEELNKLRQLFLQ